MINQKIYWKRSFYLSTTLLFFVGVIFFLKIIRETEGDKRQRLREVPVLGLLARQHDQTSAKLIVKTLDHMIPSFDSLVKFITGASTDRQGIAKRYLEYYRAVVNVYPQETPAQGILGFCYYYSGQEKKAQEQFLNAIKLNPVYFWHYYNLGVMAYLKSDFSDSAFYFQKAVDCPLPATLKALSSALSYQQIAAGIAFDPSVGLKAEYARAVFLFGKSLERMGNKEGRTLIQQAAEKMPEDFFNDRDISLKIF